MAEESDFEADTASSLGGLSDEFHSLLQPTPAVANLQQNVFSSFNAGFTKEIQSLATKWMVKSENKIVAFRLLIDTWRPFFPKAQDVYDHKSMIEQLVIDGLTTQDKVLLNDKSIDGRYSSRDPASRAQRENRVAIKNRVRCAVARIVSALVDTTNAEMKKRGMNYYYV